MVERRPSVNRTPRNAEELAASLGLPAEEGAITIQRAILNSTPPEVWGEILEEEERARMAKEVIYNPILSGTAGITEAQRVAASLYYGEDMSFRAVARQVGVSPSTARRRALTGFQKARTFVTNR